ncbi:glutathione S-transferase family protein [Pikeienuella piscinae]|uniref:Glutathione S-transferase family protein n=1 Tax=Pikeienuella piscinae TaxID=2748098 RepID=A0A7L5C2H7_9RHOB|nr:glutathione S-transferase family protein [Pikeienuella piscinae]QIE57047.1 glutathione S-transferase family protein [Pikeienuella piscinae]
MGKLIDGKWRNVWYDTKSTGGAFERQESQFRNWITKDGAPGPSGVGGFAAESGRYHLYVSHACPWAHRTQIFRKLKGLKPHIGVDVVDPDMLSEGWTLEGAFPGATGDRLLGKTRLHQVYTAAKPEATTRVTVPVLWDKERATIVSNESAEIIRMFNTAFDGITGDRQDFYPAPLRDEIDALNERIYETVNNGVYRAGFATTQAAYNEAVNALFETLDWLEERLGARRYLTGAQITEADWRLFTTLARFDAVYVGHFKCDRRRLVDYPNLWGYARELYQWPGVAETVRFDHIRRHYYYSHETINPNRIVSTGPVIDWQAPHGREQLKAA